jgi:hypothetical protein
VVEKVSRVCEGKNLRLTRFRKPRLKMNTSPCGGRRSSRPRELQHWESKKTVDRARGAAPQAGW